MKYFCELYKHLLNVTYQSNPKKKPENQQKQQIKWNKPLAKLCDLVDRLPDIQM